MEDTRSKRGSWGIVPAARRSDADRGLVVGTRRAPRGRDGAPEEGEVDGKPKVKIAIPPRSSAPQPITSPRNEQQDMLIKEMKKKMTTHEGSAPAPPLSPTKTAGTWVSASIPTGLSSSPPEEKQPPPPQEETPQVISPRLAGEPAQVNKAKQLASVAAEAKLKAAERSTQYKAAPLVQLSELDGSAPTKPLNNTGTFSNKNWQVEKEPPRQKDVASNTGANGWDNFSVPPGAAPCIPKEPQRAARVEEEVIETSHEMVAEEILILDEDSQQDSEMRYEVVEEVLELSSAVDAHEEQYLDEEEERAIIEEYEQVFGITITESGELVPDDLAEAQLSEESVALAPDDTTQPVFAEPSFGPPPLPPTMTEEESETTPDTSSPPKNLPQIQPTPTEPTPAGPNPLANSSSASFYR